LPETGSNHMDRALDKHNSDGGQTMNVF